jgi:hypothetical protein
MSMRVRAAALLALAALAVACGGDGDDEATTTAPPDDTSEDSAAPLETTEALDVEVSFAGFLLALDEVTFTPGEGDLGTASVTVTGTAENVGPENAQVPQSEVFIDRDGEAYDLDFAQSELPEVPGESTGEVAYAFVISDSEFGLDGAVLTFGESGTTQALVPLDGEGEVVANMPVEIDVTGTVTAGETEFLVEGAEVRFDRPDRHEQAEEGGAFLYVRYAVSNNSSFAGGYPFTGDDTRLETPAGLGLAPVEFPIELLAASSSLPDLVTIWEIDADEPGTYLFIGLRNPGTPTEAKGQLEIEVPELLAEG